MPARVQRCTLESERRYIPVREDRRFSREEITTVVVGPVSCATTTTTKTKTGKTRRKRRRRKRGKRTTRTMRRKSRFGRLPTVTKVMVGHPHVALKYESEVLGGNA
jgi:hypothetical protein